MCTVLAQKSAAIITGQKLMVFFNGEGKLYICFDGIFCFPLSLLSQYACPICRFVLPSGYV